MWSIDSQKKISKFDATKCPIVRLKCTKFDFRCGSSLDPARRDYGTPQTSRLYLRGLLLKEWGRGRGGAGKGKGEEPGPQNI